MILFRIAPYLGIYLLVVIAWTLFRLERARRQIERETPRPPLSLEKKIAQYRKSERAIRESRIMAGTHRGSTK